MNFTLLLGWLIQQKTSCRCTSFHNKLFSVFALTPRSLGWLRAKLSRGEWRDPGANRGEIGLRASERSTSELQSVPRYESQPRFRSQYVRHSYSCRTNHSTYAATRTRISLIKTPANIDIGKNIKSIVIAPTWTPCTLYSRQQNPARLVWKIMIKITSNLADSDL